jgi:hypothetical protein
MYKIISISSSPLSKLIQTAFKKGIFLEGKFPVQIFMMDQRIKIPKIPDPLALLAKIAGWGFQDKPIQSGRSFLIRLQKPVKVNGVIYRTIKLKGVTDNGLEPEPTPYKVVEKEGMILVQPKVISKILPNGMMQSVDNTPKPKGMLLESEIEREFRIGRAVFDSGISTSLPIGFGLYPDFIFEGERVGFLVMLTQGASEDRVSHVFFNNQETVFKGQSISFYNAMKLLNPHLMRVFQVLGHFHREGFTHSYPHIGNFSAHKDTSIIDFTAAYHVSELSEKQFGMRLFMDYMEAVSQVYLFLRLNQLQQVFDDNRHKPDIQEMNPLQNTPAYYFGLEVVEQNPILKESTGEVVRSIYEDRIDLPSGYQVSLEELDHPFIRWFEAYSLNLYAQIKNRL